MCTVSWFHTASGYQLFSNRDERLTRLPAEPPAVRVKNGVRFVAPRDGDHGGSWIGVNQFGLSLCLLNHYADEITARQGPAFVSRGLLLTELIACPTQAQTHGRLAQTDLTRFRPFTLLALEPGRPVWVWHWAGGNLTQVENGDALLPLVSSSYDAPGVSAARRQQFGDLALKKIDAQLLRAYHASHAPTASAYSVCMHRADARTVSLSHIRVTHKRLEFIYYPAAPCAFNGTPHSIQMERI